jgi:copper chaperone CopZ
MSATKIIKIEGMSCSHCSKAVEKVLSALVGVSAKVDLEAGIATVVMSEDVSNEALKNAIEDEDYKVVSIS